MVQRGGQEWFGARDRLIEGEAGASVWPPACACCPSMPTHLQQRPSILFQQLQQALCILCVLQQGRGRCGVGWAAPRVTLLQSRHICPSRLPTRKQRPCLRGKLCSFRRPSPWRAYLYTIYQQHRGSATRGQQLAAGGGAQLLRAARQRRPPGLGWVLLVGRQQALLAQPLSHVEPLRPLAQRGAESATEQALADAGRADHRHCTRGPHGLHNPVGWRPRAFRWLSGAWQKGKGCGTSSNTPESGAAVLRASASRRALRGRAERLQRSCESEQTARQKSSQQARWPPTANTANTSACGGLPPSLA